jgi:nicotinate-nucleotide pyrophosphorylase (carboxylating)
MGLDAAVESFRDRKSFATNLEVEVESPTAAVRAADAGADIVLLDNLPPTSVEEAVDMVPDDVVTEASGGITIEELPAYAETGVDVVSMGSLTHSAPSLDVSFRADGR